MTRTFLIEKFSRWIIAAMGVQKTGKNTLLFVLLAFFSAFVAPIFSANPSHAACSSWRSPAKVWFNEYFFGIGANNPPNFLEIYTSSPAFATQWQDSTVEVYTADEAKTVYTLTAANTTACTISGKTWITQNVSAGLENKQALVIFKDPQGNTIDALVFDGNKAPPTPWESATNTWAPGNTTGCTALDSALTTQAALAVARPSFQENMAIPESSGNKGYHRVPDGGPLWQNTEFTGAGTTYTQCTSNNANFTKGVDLTTPPPGSTVTFSLLLANTSGGTLSGLSVIDDLPDYSYPGSLAPTFVSAIPVNPSDTVSTGSYSTVDPNPIVSDIPTNTPATATRLTWSPAPIPEGTTARLNIKLQLPSNAETGYLYKNVAQTTGITPNQTDFADFTVGSPNVGSFVITVNPASASTCTSDPLLAPKITITAMTGPNGTGTVDTAYTGLVNGNSVVYLAASAANIIWYNSVGSQITISPVPVGSFVNGVASFYLRSTASQTITISAIDPSTYGTNIMQGVSGSISYTSDNIAITLTDIDTLTPTYGVVANRPHRLQATISDCGVPATDRTATYPGTIRYSAGGNHPAGAAAPTIATTAACPGAIGPLSPSSDTPISLAFVAGVANNFYLCTSDVGQFSLSLTVNLTAPTSTVSGSSGNFTVRPFVLTASDFTDGDITSSNPQGSAPTDTVFARAGVPFSGTFNAWRWRSNEDSDNNGLPDSGVTVTHFSAATHGSTLPSFSGSTNNAGRISFSTKCNTPITCAGDISPNTIDATASAGTVTLTSTLSYPEVGSMVVSGPAADPPYGATNYLGMSGLHVPILSDVVGRFIPHHFDIALVEGCTGFTYSGQPLPIKVTAKNLSGTTPTQNYASGSFAKDGTLSDVNNASGTFSPAMISQDKYSAGVANLLMSPELTFTFTNKETVPAELRVRITDEDGVSSSDGSEMTTQLRSGRVRLLNTHGSELIPLELEARVEFWHGSPAIWKNNTDDDDCSQIPAGAIAASGGIAANTCFLDNPPPSPPSNANCLTESPANSFTDAKASWVLFDKTSPRIGYTDLILNLSSLSWLQYDWDQNGSHDNNPTGRVTFGIQRGNDRIINWREIMR